MYPHLRKDRKRKSIPIEKWGKILELLKLVKMQMDDKVNNKGFYFPHQITTPIVHARTQSTTTQATAEFSKHRYIAHAHINATPKNHTKPNKTQFFSALQAQGVERNKESYRIAVLVSYQTENMGENAIAR